MKKVTVISALCILLVFVFFGSISCGGETGVKQADYDALNAQLTAAQTEIANLKAKASVTVNVPQDPALKDEIASLKAKVASLGTEIAALNQQKDSLTQAKAASEAQYTALTKDYQELQKLMDSTTLPATVTEEQIENEIFGLLNAERVKAGLPAFILGEHLYPQAKQNSRNMAAAGKFVYDPAVFYQEVFWAAGYNSLKPIGRGALLTWKANQFNFEHGALLPANIYGAVGAYKAGEIVYITFSAANFR